jgi:RNA polymerase sigma-70 factor, ECF subfamily
VDPTDRSLLHEQMIRLADGDREAFNPVFLRLWPLVRGFAKRYLPHEDAEDAAQQALLRVFAHAAEFDRERDALSWVLGVAAWEIRTVRRRRQRRKEDPVDDSAVASRAAAGVDPEQQAIDRDVVMAMERAMASLRPEDAGTLRAFLRGERPAVKAATFRKRVQRALERLRSAWSSHGE